MKPILSCSHFDGSIVLCEEVRVKIEAADTFEETQDPLIDFESKKMDVGELGVSTDGKEGFDHAAVRIKECSVMLQRRILEKVNFERSGGGEILQGKASNWSVDQRARSEENVKMNHDKGSVCNDCGRQFLDRRLLSVHVKRAHQREPSTRNLKCKIVGCENPFYSKLDVHMRMVHGHPKLKCQFENCAAEFYSRQGMKKHIVRKHEISVHRGVK